MASGLERFVLVVDDDACIARAICHIMRRQGYDCMALYDGEMAIEFLRFHTVDVVILDLHMPGMSGADVLRLASVGSSLRANTKVVVYSADYECAAHVMAMGADDFIRKGASIDAIVEKVRRSLTA